MSAANAGAYVSTRVAVLGSRLLDDDGLQRLQERSVDQLGEDLGVRAILESDLPAERKNRAVEQALIQRLMLDVTIVQRPLSGAARALVVYWARKFELFNLKALIRGKINGLSAAQIQDNLYELPQLIRLPHQELLRTESVCELLRRLESGPYGDIAFRARRNFEEKQQAFLLDATIDQRYFVGLAKHALLCPSHDRQQLRSLIGTLIDRENILWLLRYRFSYELTASEAYYLMVTSGGTLGREVLLQLVNLQSFEQVLQSLPAPWSERLQGAETQMDAERALETSTLVVAREKMHYASSAITRALAYLVLRETDLRRQFSISQGKVLGLPDELIRFAVGLKPEHPGAAAAL